MRPNLLCIAVAAFALWQAPTQLVAQTEPGATPDFSGTWKMDQARSEAAAQDQPVGDVTVVITQTGSKLTIKTIRDGANETAVYPIEAHPSVPTDEAVARRAYWDGSRLVDEGSVDINGQTIGFREIRTPGLGGKEMEVQTTLKIEHGYELKGAQTVVTGKNVFVRLP